ncbi:MAG: recombinase zinc beta ribbon domain-containing protein [Parcubacteria group bacterium]|nr:recombinase zinc beta ribbon domain-containing protein [Parcubacteria group bacterium]
MTAKNQEFPGLHEKTTTEEIFYKCQKLLGKKEENTKNKYKNKNNEHFPLRHFVICSKCGRPLTAAFSRGRHGGYFPYYRCYNKNCNSKRSISKKILEDSFLLLLKEITPKKQFLEKFKKIILQVWSENYKQINKERELIFKKLNALEQEKNEIIKMRVNKEISEKDFKSYFSKHKEKIENQKILLNDTKIENFDIEEAINFVFKFLLNIHSFWKSADYEQKQKLQGLIFTEKPVYNYEKFETPKISLILDTKKTCSMSKSLLVPSRGIEPLLLE